MKRFLLFTIICSLFLFYNRGMSQSCGTPNKNGAVTLNNFPNTYYPGTAALVPAGSTAVPVGAKVGGNTIVGGDLVLIIQMQGADIEPENTNARYGDNVAGGFGNGYLINAGLQAGVFEFGVAAATLPASGGTLQLVDPLINSYANSNYVGPTPGPESQGQRRYQVIRVPQNSDITLGANIQPPFWNGSTGGVLVLEARSTFTFNGFSLDASGRGFRGGGGRQLNGISNPAPGGPDDYLQLSTFNVNGSKGEGIAGTPHFYSNPSNGITINNTVEGYKEGSVCKGAPGNAGGGATDGQQASNTENAGGGGGANGNVGGKGGNTWDSNLPGGGEPGAAFAQSSPSRMVMGGGGGAGSNNDGSGAKALGASSSGAAGGGIVIIRARTFLDAGVINANGSSADNTVTTDGSGGGGAGGSVLVIGAIGLFNVTVNANGGNGGSNTPGPGNPHGPGGGGSGGYIYSTSALASFSVDGGLAGTTDGGINYGATDGGDGISNTSILLSTLPAYYVLCGSTLPIRLLNFTGAVENSSVVLKWSTSQEVNSDYIQVEKSSNGRDWETAAVLAAASYSNTVRNYQTIDSRPVNGKNFYRLKMVDKDGDYTYSSILIVTFNGKGFGIVLAPNPNKGRFGIYSEKPFSASATVRIVSSTGQIIAQRKIGNLMAVTFEDLKLSSGVYSAIINDDGTVVTKKFVVQ